MGTDAPTIITLPVRCAPKKAPCPKCGKRGRRKRTLTPAEPEAATAAMPVKRAGTRAHERQRSRQVA